MATPTREDWEKVVRLGRYLKGKPRVRIWYEFQETPTMLETYSDTDWAGCRRTRRSTTGGYMVYGKHLIKMWCKTQAVIALSSAEAELYGLVRAAAETLGAMSLYKDIGKKVEGRVLGDASAALAIIARQGIGKLRHLDTNYLWIQEKAAKKEIDFKKVEGKKNGADLMTKPLAWEEIEVHSERMKQKFEEVKIDSAPVESLEVSQNFIRRALAATYVKLNLPEGLGVWQRTDLGARTFKTSMKNGPAWPDVEARITVNAETGKVLQIEDAKSIRREEEHRLIPCGPVDIHTILVYKE
jgi:hypothetical protein